MNTLKFNKIEKIKGKKFRKGNEFDQDKTFKLERDLARKSKRFNQYQNYY